MSAVMLDGREVDVTFSIAKKRIEETGFIIQDYTTKQQVMSVASHKMCRKTQQYLLLIPPVYSLILRLSIQIS